MVSKVALVDYLKTQSEIYCECPFCSEIFRLNEAKLMFGKKAKKDLLDRLRELKSEFERRLEEEREDARKRSRAVSKGMMLENICPYLPNFKHHPRDARFIGDPIDFVIFDGLFSKGRISEVVVAEVKSGNATLNDVEKSIKRAIEKGRVDFELLRIK
ncbi:MAG: Holliday junction resolvase-like protein [Candidatus Bathyarchaeia archaeon]